ncbi:MAG: amino acid ABC transporter permease [Anaerolineae bacterium]
MKGTAALFQYQFEFGPVLENLPFLLRAVGVTLQVMAYAWVLSLVIGIIAGQLRLSHYRWVRLIATAYIDFFRTTPLLVQLVWIFYVIPIIFGIRTTDFQSGVLALSLNYGAFFAEVFRAGVTSIGRGQSEAGSALGMTTLQVLYRVVYPQAIRRMLPPLGSMTVSLLKDTALVSVIGIQDLMNAAQNLTAQTFRPLEVLTTVAIIYFLLTYPIAWISDYFHKRNVLSHAA